MITNYLPSDWKDLQNSVAKILEECRFKVEIEKTVDTARGEVELDVLAEEDVKGRKYKIICECKYWKKSVPKSIVHSFRTVVSDIGANIGYVISLNGFQSGSVNAAEFTNIELVNWKQFQEKYFQLWYDEHFTNIITLELNELYGYTEPMFPSWFNKLSDRGMDEFVELKDKYSAFGMLFLSFSRYGRVFRNLDIPELPLSNRLKSGIYKMNTIPDEITNETGYRELLEKSLKYGKTAIEEFRKIKNTV